MKSQQTRILSILILATLAVGVTLSVVYFSQPTEVPTTTIIPTTTTTPIQTPLDVEVNLIGEIDTGGSALSVQVDDELAFVIDFGEDTTHGLIIIDVSDPVQPEILGTFHAGGLPFAIESKDEIVYLADQLEGLRIIDISDPANPVEIEGYVGSGMAFDLEIEGDFLFMADYEYGMVVLDISSPSNPVFVSNLGPDCGHLEIIENIAYIAGSGRIRIVDVSDPSHPTLLGQTIQSSSTLWDPSVSNSIIYLANHSGDDGELLIFDASDPSNIEEIGEFDSEGTFQSFFVQDSLLYAVDFESGLYILDVTDSTSPFEIDRFSEGQPWDVTIYDGFVYLVGSEGLQILQVTHT
ncbi:MAG: LVIVD repeat-containing protein [Candidatus Hodarchaeota archaeon]